MQTRLLVFSLSALPILLAAFAGGVVFERYRHQTPSIQGTSASLSALPVDDRSFSKAQERVPALIADMSPPLVETTLRTRPNSVEPKIEEAMQAIRAAWEDAIENERLLPVKMGSCYGARYIRRGAEVRANLKRTDTAMEGIVRIRGMAAVNQPSDKYVCAKSISEALAADRRQHENLGPVDAILTYKIGGGKFRLDRIDSEPVWLITAVVDSLRLNLNSWNTVAMQPIN